jgi:SAM-dependent methyltransferase
VAIATGIRRDPRLKGVAADAENTEFKSESFDLVIVQDGLHHLASPVRGFTEMLRIARVGVIFVEPHDALVGKIIGTKWEQNGDAINYVFRWTHKLVEQVASSYLGRERFRNHSYAYWHHNMVFAKLGSLVGGGKRGEILIRVIKLVSRLLPFAGNCFTAIVIKRASLINVSQYMKSV